MRILILIFFLFFNLTNADSLDQKNKLDALFNQLKKVNNSKTAELLEKKIWAVWSQHPEDKKLTEKYYKLISISERSSINIKN